MSQTVQSLYDNLFKAAKKQAAAIKAGLLTHSPICNFQGEHCKKCNCGVADLITAVKEIEKFNGQ